MPPWVLTGELIISDRAHLVRVEALSSLTNNPEADAVLTGLRRPASSREELYEMAARYLQETVTWLQCRELASSDPCRKGADLIGPVAHRLGELGLLAEDWDSYGGHAPTTVARTTAMRFYQRLVRDFGLLFGEAVVPTSISPLPTGGVELEWRSDNRLIAIDVGPGGAWGYLWKVGRGPSAWRKEANNVPEAQLALLIFRELATRL
jgi:hypothetical protein